MKFAPEVTLSVIVCTYNRKSLLLHALGSLAEQTLNGAQFEVIIVDNNSTDSTSNMVEQFCDQFVNFRLLHESRQGLSYARNHGWQEARGDLIAFMDDDARAEPDWCERIVGAFKSVEPLPVSVGGMIFPCYETTPPCWFVDDFEIRTWGDEARFLSGIWEQFGFSGSNMAFLRTALEQHGGFRVDLGMFGTKIRLGEESDFSFRLYRESPRFWYDPKIKVRHWVPKEHMRVSYLMKRSFQSGRSRAMIQPCKVFSFEYLQALNGQVWTIKELLTGNFPLGSDTKTKLVRKMCRMLNQTGLLLGPRR